MVTVEGARYISISYRYRRIYPGDANIPQLNGADPARILRVNFPHLGHAESSIRYTSQGENYVGSENKSLSFFQITLAHSRRRTVIVDRWICQCAYHGP